LCPSNFVSTQGTVPERNLIYNAREDIVEAFTILPDPPRIIVGFQCPRHFAFGNRFSVDIDCCCFAIVGKSNVDPFTCCWQIGCDISSAAFGFKAEFENPTFAE